MAPKVLGKVCECQLIPTPTFDSHNAIGRARLRGNELEEALMPYQCWPTGKVSAPLRCIAIAALLFASGTWPQLTFGQTKADSPKLKIGVIGSGNIGATVGALWVKAGHQVLFSSRNPEKLKELVEGLGPLARAGTVQEALSFGDVVLLGVPYGAYPQIGKDYGAQFK